MTGKWLKWLPALLTGGAIAMTGMTAAAEEEMVKVQAFSTWTFAGEAVKSGAEEVTVVGSMHGPVFIDAGQGPILAGNSVCPGTLTVDLTDGSQVGKGVCLFRAKDGAEAYGHWDCTGYHLLGCKGSFSFTGGSDRLSGIAGGSDLMIRGEFQAMAKSGGMIAEDQVIGVTVFRDLAATLPAKE